MKKSLYVTGLIVGAIVVAVSCSKLEPAAPADDELLDGPVEGLSTAQQAQFLAGDVAFNDEIFTREKGLGSIFVATSCGSCHAGDGKGHPFTTLTRFGINDSLGKNEFDNGPQLQDRALPGFMPEVLRPGVPFARFTPPANTGMGFLELVSEDDLLAMAAGNATNPDGVRGHPNYSALPSFVTPPPNSHTQNGRYITRFGKKAATFNLFHQTVQAYNQDIGITSTFNPSDVYSHLDIDPEVSDKTVRDVIFYLQTLKAPIQRNQSNPDVIQGGALFTQVGCQSCHKQTLTTGFSPVEALSNKQFHPYTDLLLHDMGAALDDGYTEGTAQTSEWRTPPLWGLGLSKNSQGGKYFLLHDGRAKGIDEAIQFHGGEATTSKNKFNALNAAEREQVIKFLESL